MLRHVQAIQILLIPSGLTLVQVMPKIIKESIAIIVLVLEAKQEHNAVLAEKYCLMVREQHLTTVNLVVLVQDLNSVVVSTPRPSQPLPTPLSQPLPTPLS